MCCDRYRKHASAWEMYDKVEVTWEYPHIHRQASWIKHTPREHLMMAILRFLWFLHIVVRIGGLMYPSIFLRVVSLTHGISGPRLNMETVFAGMRIPLKIRRPWDRLIIIIGIPILVRHLYIETAPLLPHKFRRGIFSLALFKCIVKVILL